MANRVRVNILQFCLVSNSLSHTTFQIKWEVYFTKRLSHRYYCVEYATIFNKNTVKLSYSCMPNISTLINRGNSKMLQRNKNTEPPNYICIKKENCPLKGRCQIECVVYKAEELIQSNDSNNRNDKKVYVCSTQDPFKQRYYNHKSRAVHEMVLDATFLYTQHYKVRIKGKVEQSREWSITLPYTSV